MKLAPGYASLPARRIHYLRHRSMSKLMNPARWKRRVPRGFRRKDMRRRFTLVLVIIALSTVATLNIVSADNWPQWRGPALNGVSGEKNLPVKWTVEENVTWKLEMSAWSGSTPIIWGDYIFLNASEGEMGKSVNGETNRSVKGDIYLWCVDRTQGTAVWTKWIGS